MARQEEDTMTGSLEMEESPQNSEDETEEPQQKRQVQVPYSDPISAEWRQRLVDGVVNVVIRGRLQCTSKRQSLLIAICDGLDLNSSDNFPICFEAEFLDDSSNFASKVDLVYKQEGSVSIQGGMECNMDLKRGSDFQIVFSIRPQMYRVEINGLGGKDFQRKVPFTTVNRLVIKGDGLTLYEPDFRMVKWGRDE